MVDKTTNIKLLILKQYLSNYLAQYHVRELAKIIGKSHVTLLPHLNSLEEGKVLNQKKAGKNKIFSLNLDNPVTRNYILAAEGIETAKFLEQSFLIKKVFNDIFKLKLEGAIMLFGSYAKKTQKADSDIDILYIGEISELQTEYIKKAGQIYGKKINVKKTSAANFEDAIRKKDNLIIEIIKNHIILQNAEMFVNTLWRYYNEIKTI